MSPSICFASKMLNKRETESNLVKTVLLFQNAKYMGVNASIYHGIDIRPILMDLKRKLREKYCIKKKMEMLFISFS
jgi:hypothetical protein